jgi:hypothetical protein
MFALGTILLICGGNLGFFGMRRISRVRNLGF